MARLVVLPFKDKLCFSMDPFYLPASCHRGHRPTYKLVIQDGLHLSVKYQYGREAHVGCVCVCVCVSVCFHLGGWGPNYQRHCHLLLGDILLLIVVCFGNFLMYLIVIFNAYQTASLSCC